jgi:putative ABC transport system permease protein
MRPNETDNGGKKILLERITPVWRRLSFNTRYSLKSMLRSKGRFFAIVSGITATVALTMLSLGFYNSLLSVQGRYFGGFTNYDMTVWYGYDPLPLSAGLEFGAELDPLTDASRALQTRALIKGESLILTVAESGFDKFNIDTAALDNGVIIPSYHAKLWKVKKGDTVRLTVPLGEISFNRDCVVSGIAEQSLALGVYTSYDYFFSGNPIFLLLDESVYKVYNSVYLKGGDLTAVKDFLNSSFSAAGYSTKDDDKNSFVAVTDSLTVLIFFMIICALILGVAVLYSVGIINLNARENEYMLLSTLGYRHNKIMQTHLKESAIQMLLAIPLGFLIGYLLLIVIKNGFSSSSFVLFAHVYWWAFVFTAVMVISLAAIMSVIVSARIKRLDIIEGLKSQE